MFQISWFIDHRKCAVYVGRYLILVKQPCSCSNNDACYVIYNYTFDYIYIMEVIIVVFEFILKFCNFCAHALYSFIVVFIIQYLLSLMGFLLKFTKFWFWVYDFSVFSFQNDYSDFVFDFIDIENLFKMNWINLATRLLCML